MSKKIEYFVKLLIYLSFLVPLLVFPSFFIFPFIVPKILVFRSLVVLMLGGYVSLLIINYQKYKPEFTAINIVVSFFLVSFTLSTFLGVDSYHSFWDNHERMLGLLTITHYIIYYFICCSLFKNWSEWRLALKMFLFAGSIVMLLGLVQVFDHNFLMNQGSDRVASTLGNAIYVGGYGLFLFFVALLLWAKEKDRFWKYIFAILGVLALLGLVYSGTRGSVLGLVVGIVVLVVEYAILLKSNPKARKILLGVIVFGALSFVVLFVNRESSWVSNIPAVGRLLGTSLSSANTRFFAWQAAIDGWRERPVFGWGPNNFFYAFNKHYNPRSLEYGYGETWFDNAHNILLNTLTVQGIFGLLSYLAIFAVSVLILWWNVERRKNNLHFIAIASAFLVAHLVQNITVFENPTSYMYFVFWLALINRLTSISTVNTNKEDKKLVRVEKQMSVFLLSFIFGSCLIVIFIFNIQPARANMKTLNALNALYQNSASGRLLASSALDFNSPHIDDIRNDISRTIGQVLNSARENVDKKANLELLNVAYENLKKNLVLHPMDIRNHLSLAQLGQMGLVLSNEPRYPTEAEGFLEDALVYSPKRQQVLYMLASVKLQLGKTIESAQILETALNLDPKVGESYWRLAYTYYLAGQKDKAKEILGWAEKQQVSLGGQGQSIIDTILADTDSKKK